jgi:gliding motility-associated-like protein
VDSVVQLYLRVYPREQKVIDTILCQDETLTVGDSILGEVGSYEIKLQSKYGCDSIVIINLDYERLEVDDSIISDYGCQNGEIKLDMQGNNPPYAFRWSNGSSEKDISGLKTGDYGLTVTDKSGCESEYEYTIGDSIPYLIPNAFFPSGQEEINSTFRIYHASGVQIKTTEIYDRWGEKVFSGGRDEYWDGSYKGEVQAPGVYLYKVEIESPCGEEVKKGQVMLLR